VSARTAQSCGRGNGCTVVHGRDISFTKVKVLPELLGKCTHLKTLCVRSAAAVRVQLAVAWLVPTGRAS
jgi:hypothetical protein